MFLHVFRTISSFFDAASYEETLPPSGIGLVLLPGEVRIAMESYRY